MKVKLIPLITSVFALAGAGAAAFLVYKQIQKRKQNELEADESELYLYRSSMNGYTSDEEDEEDEDISKIRKQGKNSEAKTKKKGKTSKAKAGNTEKKVSPKKQRAKFEEATGENYKGKPIFRGRQGATYYYSDTGTRMYMKKTEEG